MNSLIDTIFRVAVGKKTLLIRIFQCVYIGMIIFLFLGSQSVYFSDPNAGFFRQFSVTAGEYAIILFVVTLIPGIAKRFGVNHKLVSILRIYRRYIGILMYLLVLYHMGMFWLIPSLAAKTLFPLVTFTLYGFIAQMFLFFLFVTSNDWSVQKLGIWWYRLHRVIYLILGLIFLHVALQRMSTWTIIMGGAVIIQIVSFLVAWLRNKRAPIPPPQATA